MLPKAIRITRMYIDNNKIIYHGAVGVMLRRQNLVHSSLYPGSPSTQA